MATIQAFHHRKQKKKLTLELDFDLSENLKQYTAYYRDALGGEVGTAELATEIVRQFLAQDDQFQKHRGKPSIRENRAAQSALTAA